MNLRSLLLPSTTLIAAILNASSLHAQTPPSGDPFVKPAAGALAAPTGEQKTEPWRNCFCTFEVYALDKNDAFAVLDAERGSAARYRRVLDLARTGKARLATLTALATKSGQRAVVEAMDEVQIPKDFLPANGETSLASPRGWTARHAGDTFEFEPVLSPDGRVCDLILAPQRTTLVGFRDYAAPANSAPVSQPIFDFQKLTTSTTMAVGETHYLGSFTPPTPQGIANGAAPSEVWLAFISLNLQGPTAEELKPPAKPAAWSAIQLEYVCYSLDRAPAREVLLTSGPIGAPWEKVQALVAERKARLEHVTSIKTKSGQRALAEETQELPFATDYNPEEKQASGTAFPGWVSGFDKRSGGVTVEIEPILLADQVTVDLNHVVQSIASVGDLKVTGIAARYLPQTVFETRKLTTSQSILAGRYQLIGTLNPPGADGVNERANSGRTWLLFVRTMPNDP